MTSLRNKKGERLHRVDERDLLEGANLGGLNLRELSAEGFVAIDADFTGTILEGADLYWGIFSRANFTDVDLRDAILCGAVLNEANFTRADLRGANLGKDNLNGETNISGAIFADAVYDDRTVFPDGFDPDSNGMRRLD